MRTIFRFLPAVVLSCLLASQSFAQEGVRWHSDLQAARQLAAQTDRLVLVHFWATWCHWCKPLDREVFNQTWLGQNLEAHYVPVKLNYDDHRDVAQRYGVKYVPWDVILTPSGDLVRDLKSPTSAQQYAATMTEIAQSARPPDRTLLAAAAPYDSRGAVAPVAANLPQANQAGQTMTANQNHWSDSRYAGYHDPRVAVRTDAVQPPVAQQYGPGGESIGSTYHSGQVPPPPNHSQIQPQFQNGPQSQVPPPAYQPPALVGQSHQPPAHQAPAHQPPANVQSHSQVDFNPLAQRPGSTPEPQPSGPAFGLDGYCPVHLTENTEWVAGDRRWGAVHRGLTYLFASPGCQQKFLAEPDRFSPVLSGNDPVLLVERGQMVPGRREHGCFFGNEPNRRIILFADEASYQAFERNPQRYSAALEQAR